MDFGEALERMIGVDPKQLPDSVMLKRKKPPPKREPVTSTKGDKP
jgi:hypothetical protein